MLTRNCSIDGDIVCSTEYENGNFDQKNVNFLTNLLIAIPVIAVCETVYEEHRVMEDVANCKNELFEMCKTDDLGEVWKTTKL